MSVYTLNEAYVELYETKDVEDIFDNLRFIDYMQDDDIQEVVESLVWEFRDYGSTLDEAFDILSYAASDDVICEAYDQLALDILSEARILDLEARRKRNKQYAIDSENAAKQARKNADTTQRREARRARVDGAISKVKSAIAGAKGGMGRASIALGGAVKKAGSAANSAAQKGKALLGSLLRKGASTAGKAVSGAGKALEKSGQRASQSGLASRQAGRATRSGQMSLVLEPTTREKTGGTASKVGRAIRKVGTALQRKASNKTSSVAPTPQKPKMTRSEYDQRKSERSASAKAQVGDAFAKPKPVLALPAKTSGQPIRQRELSDRQKAAAAKIEKAAKGSAARGVRFAGPNATLDKTRTNTGYKERLARFATKLNKEDYELLVNYILEDIIDEGYAEDLFEALDVFERLTEDAVVDIALDYFND